ncbi:DnaJ-domain-containing protein [Neoconidiobolus thromboides FSU 785]|nr:DnaJ-domain-containing protein [Neoconidiobolus thromboides FSU 785]
MEVNKDEAIRCLAIAKKKEQQGDYSSALKFCRKSIALFPTDQAKQYLKIIEPKSKESPEKVKVEIKQEKESVKMSNSNSSSRAYTKEQVEEVIEIKRNSGDFYKILRITKEATENEIKKAYKKLALKFHPDKNSAPGADEAFKLVSKAFSVLSDPDKKSAYDRYGGDPEQRNSGPQYNPGFRYQEEVSPEELFNMFFGASNFGPGFHSTFVGPDGRQYMRRNRQQPRANTTQFETNFNLIQLLPILLLLVFSLFSTLFTPANLREPDYTFERAPRFTKSYNTQSRGITYYADPKEMLTFKSKANKQRFNQFEKDVESYYVRSVYQQCINQRDRLNSEIAEATGWFGWNRNEKRLKELRSRRLPKCDEYRRLIG